MVATDKAIKPRKHFEKWSEGKSPLLKMLSFVLADGQGEIQEFLQNVKAGKKMGGYDCLPPVDEWLKFYRNHRRIYRGVTDSFRQINNDVAKAIDFYEEYLSAVRLLRHITKDELQEIMEELTTAERNRNEKRFQEIQKMIINNFNMDNVETKKGTEEEERERLSALLNKPEVIFFMRVWAPCLYLYGDYSTSLLRKARQGDDDALEKLLRLDKTVIGDKKIMELFHQGKVAKKQAIHDLFIKSLTKKPGVNLTRRKFKHELAGLISAVSISLGQRLTSTKIKELFDANSKDAGKGSDIDFKDQNKPQALTKAINRARSNWPTIPRPDKK